MRVMNKRISALLMAGMLLLCGCTGAAREIPAGVSENEVAIAASFSQEDGIALCGSTVRCSFGESSTDHSLDHNGELRVSGLPRVGELLLTVLDQQEHVQGDMTLSFSEGAVIDATTDERGIGHVTLRGDTDEVALLFILKDDGSLRCSLRLIQSDPYSVDLSQEEECHAHFGSGR